MRAEDWFRLLAFFLLLKLVGLSLSLWEWEGALTALPDL